VYFEPFLTDLLTEMPPLRRRGNALSHGNFTGASKKIYDRPFLF